MNQICTSEMGVSKNDPPKKLRRNRCFTKLRDFINKKHIYQTPFQPNAQVYFIFFLNTNKFEDANTKYQVLQVVTSFGPTSDLFRAFQGLHLGNQQVTLKKLVEKSKNY